MKKRPDGFLSEENISHDSEIFDYIKELHGYLWKFIRTQNPGASGSLDDILVEPQEVTTVTNVTQIGPNNTIIIGNIKNLKL